MINEHIKAKRQKIALGGAPKNMKDEEFDETFWSKVEGLQETTTDPPMPPSEDFERYW